MKTLACLGLWVLAVLAPQGLEKAEIGSTKNVHRLGDLWFGGQFAEEDIAELADAGIRRVITLREDGELGWDERAGVEAAGIEFVALGFREPETLTDAVFDRLRALLATDGVPTFLHCASANRVGAAWIPYRVLDQGVPLEQALAEAREIGLSTEAYGRLAAAYVERQAGRPATPEPSVRPGVNDDFKVADLDVEQWLGRFEVESREVFAARHAVVAALGVKTGLRVADVGAGTGLYTFLLCEAVGAEGWVYAIDIAPRFLEHILELAAERRVANVTGVLCPETDIALPPGSIDLAFVCDTYHHFEFPVSTLRSIHRALAPGGRLVVLDFERLEGQSRPWVLEHVRAGKDATRAEIEAGGFEFVRELEVAGLAENYVIEFRKPAR
jgi:uncharacterized protein (TIGR01244 family)